MQDLPEGVESRFRYVMLVSKRAEQLIQGAAPKVRTRHAKPTRVAMDEIDRKLVKWQLSEELAEQSAEPLSE
jgi:DNA-directed RNA polymerase omega subunit